jgi:hypothetical protein
MAVRHALEHVSEVGEWLDIVELCRGDEGADYGPSLSAAIGAGEQMVELGAEFPVISLIRRSNSLFCRVGKLAESAREFRCL